MRTYSVSLIVIIVVIVTMIIGGLTCKKKDTAETTIEKIEKHQNITTGYTITKEAKA
jgi:hypothetical protein